MIKLYIEDHEGKILETGHKFLIFDYILHFVGSNITLVRNKAVADRHLLIFFIHLLVLDKHNLPPEMLIISF